MTNSGKKINVIEIGPRDGFQNIKEYIPLDIKLKIVDSLIAAGVKHLEHTSFVSPKAIPQLKDAAELTRILLERHPGVFLFALVPNLHGAKMAYELGLKKVAYVASLSKSHNLANINRTHEQSFEEFLLIRKNHPGLDVVLDVATTFGCPFEGKMRDPGMVLRFIQPYVDNGVKTVCLCDTIGIADPAQLREIVAATRSAFPAIEFQVHIHDTRNMGMTNTLAAIEAGIASVQSTLGGLGGCPFAPGASGNLSTEDLVYMLNEMGYETGIDFARCVAAAKYEKTVIDGSYSGHHMNIEKVTETSCPCS